MRAPTSRRAPRAMLGTCSRVWSSRTRSPSNGRSTTATPCAPAVRSAPNTPRASRSATPKPRSRCASYPSAKNLGHGQGYRYPHDAPSGWVEQEYRPPEVAGERFYEPGSHGAEGAIVNDWRARRGESRERDRGDRDDRDDREDGDDR